VEVGGELRLKRAGQLLLALGQEGARMIENGAQIGRGADMLRGQSDDSGPADRRVPEFAASLMKLGDPDQPHQVALVGLQRGFERRPLGRIVAAEPVHLGEVEPQRRGAWIGPRRRLEMLARGGHVVAPHRFHPEHVEGCRVVGPKPQCRLDLPRDVARPALLLRLHRARQVLLGGHAHESR